MSPFRLYPLLATCASAAVLTSALAGPGIAQTSVQPGKRVIQAVPGDLPIVVDDATTLPATAGSPPAGDGAQTVPSAFVRDRLIVTYEASVDMIDVINAIINDTPVNGRPVDASFQEIMPGVGVVSAQVAGLPQRKDSAVNAIIAADDPGVEQLATTQLRAQLAGIQGITSVERDFIKGVREIDQLNAIISGEEASGNDGTGRTNADPGDGTAPSQPDPDARPDSRTDTSPTPPADDAPAQTPPATAEPLMPNDRLFTAQWHYQVFGDAHSPTANPGAASFPLAWRENQGAATVTVAIIDSGLVQDHPDVAYGERVLPGYDFVSQNVEFANDGTAGRDDNVDEPLLPQRTRECPNGNRAPSFHGTHVAGIAGAATSNNGVGIVGGAWNTRILPVRVLNTCGLGTDADILAGVAWAAGFEVPGVPRNENPAQILNLSLNGPSQTGCSPAFGAAFAALEQAGVLVVLAAGNDGTDVAGTSVGSCEPALTVAASDARGVQTSYSNFGAGIDLMAPGGDGRRDDGNDGLRDSILSLEKGAYGFKDGTSMAAPVVAAAAALLKSADPSLTPAAMRNILTSSVRPRTAEHCPNGCGAGLLQAVAVPPQAGVAAKGQ
ncbi:MAG: S8 family serine peptidase [Pseudomonadota bacterium]